MQHIPLSVYENEESKAYYGVDGEAMKDHQKEIYLIDCPGLVFPQAVPRHIGELLGLYPIAQVREYCSLVRYVAERMPLEKMSNLRVPDWYEDDVNQEKSYLFDDDANEDATATAAEDKLIDMIIKDQTVTKWTPRMILEAYAVKKSYYVGKGGVPDATRAGSELLKDIVDGIVLLAFTPPSVFS